MENKGDLTDSDCNISVSVSESILRIFKQVTNVWITKTVAHNALQIAWTLMLKKSCFMPVAVVIVAAGSVYFYCHVYFACLITKSNGNSDMNETKEEQKTVPEVWEYL